MNDKENTYIQWNTIHPLRRRKYATTWMNLEDIMLNKISQSQQDKY